MEEVGDGGMGPPSSLIFAIYIYIYIVFPPVDFLDPPLGRSRVCTLCVSIRGGVGMTR